MSGSDGLYFIDSLPPLDKIDMSGPDAVLSIVTPGYFSTLRIPLEKGRDFGSGDIYEAPFTAIINETLAKRSIPGHRPLSGM